jgi:putative transposase
MDILMLTRMKKLEAENAGLKKIYIEEKLNAEILNEAVTKK